MSDEKPERKRRDFLITAALATTGIGATAALWPFFASMGPAADNERKPIPFDLSTLEGTNPATLEYERAPVTIFRRTPEELSVVRATLVGRAAPDQS